VNKTIQTVESAAAAGAFHIENVYPLTGGGRFLVERIVGELVDVWAAGYRDRDDVVNRRYVAALENLITSERHRVEWSGIRLRIDPTRDPALRFPCLA
jgi:hypothetical protein